MLENDWLRRRWFEFRQGHSIYLAFILSFTNFILITYRLLIERIPALQNIFTDLWIFIIFFILVYIPASILIGRWHRITQLKVETTIGMLENPLFARMYRIMLDVQLGRATKEEIEEIRKILLDIEKKMYNNTNQH
ncbi:MAG: hypothetical protein QW416_01820 [Candidatus Nitrosocaldaceae archaeon]